VGDRGEQPERCLLLPIERGRVDDLALDLVERATAVKACFHAFLQLNPADAPPPSAEAPGGRPPSSAQRAFGSLSSPRADQMLKPEPLVEIMLDSPTPWQERERKPSAYSAALALRAVESGPAARTAGARRLTRCAVVGDPAGGADEVRGT
jgi:hypothetical protein